MIHEKIIIEERNDQEDAYLLTYFWSESRELYPGQRRPAVIICPGGGYQMTSDREAEAEALRFMAMGYHTAVLRYSVAPAVYHQALCQLAKAVSILRERKDEWLIDEDKIIVMGFSAGGHLAASLGVFWDKPFLSEASGLKAEQMQPNGLILCYPVITSGEFAHEDSFRNLCKERYEELKDELSLEKRVGPNTPKTFLWHTFEDNTVPMENSLLFLQALRRANVPAEYHLFPDGLHGIGLGSELTANENGRGIVRCCEPWSELAGRWLNREFPWWSGARIFP